MSDVDQAVRAHLSNVATAGGRLQPKDFEHGLLVDRTNTSRLAQIVATCGWPTISRFGQQADKDAWLLAQHSDRNRPFQREILALLLKHVTTGDTDAINVAYLSDRLSVADGKPQLYGTQMHDDGNCNVEPQPVDSVEAVNARRAAIGLPSLQEYVADFRRYRLPARCRVHGSAEKTDGVRQIQQLAAILGE
jgi:hypothetical protein